MTQDEFYNLKFEDLKLESVELISKTFENCCFSKSTFTETKFTGCKFIDCEFTSCNLSSIQIKNTSFSDVVFEESKLIGINWTQAKWPLVKLTSSIKFYRCNISHSSFYELDLQEIVIEECKAHDVDFRLGNFSNGSFILSDLEGSMFVNTKLYAANFKEAINYQINPNENDIRKGKFSIPEVLNLLGSFQIEMD